MKYDGPNKIYWYCFKRQLEELYYLLSFEKCISCDKNEFISHFTGKKFRIEKDYNNKLIWNNEKYLLYVVFNYLIDKKFIDSDLAGILSKHFEGITHVNYEDYHKNKNNAAAKKLKEKLDILFPAETGYRCKERLFYKARNKNKVFVVLKM